MALPRCRCAIAGDDLFLAWRPSSDTVMMTTGGTMKTKFGPISQHRESFATSTIHQIRALTSRSTPTEQHFADSINTFIFLKKNCSILIEISLKLVGVHLSITASLLQKHAPSHYLNQWWPILLTHICVAWPWRVKILLKYHLCRSCTETWLLTLAKPLLHLTNNEFDIYIFIYKT